MAVLTEPPFVNSIASLTPLPSPEHRNKPRFSGPTITRTYPAILFDMDGTIIDSTKAIVKTWERIGKYYGIDPKSILATSHGRRSIDVLKQIDPSRATWDYVRQMEGEIPLLFGDDAVEIKGARALLTELDEANMPWAVVTSGTRPLVEGWLKILRLAEPRCLVTAEDVANGKPDPACYLLGRQRLGIRGTEKPLVVEDAPAGIRAGKAAGFDVLALATTHEINELVEAGADCIVRNLESVVLETDIEEPGLLRVSFHNTLQVRD